MVPSRFLLTSAGVTVGAPQRRAVQRGHEERLGGAKFRVVFDDLDSWQDSKWLTCEYSDGDIVLARPLPANVHRCVMTYSPARLGGHDITIDCRR